ncbi:MAG TPA: hypothetical protein ENG37_00760, partial [Firmicutes bacterium]|nr:hypothetical protein [Bacillota bacterium]
MDRKVVVTGMGIISPIGMTLKDYKENLFNGVSGVGRIQAFDPSGIASQIAGEVKDFDLRKFAPEFKVTEVRRIDRFAQFAIAASLLAYKDSGLDINREDPYRIGTVIASGIGGII